MYPMSWAANPDDLEDKSGEATFMVDGKAYTFRLVAFADALRINDMLEDAHLQGKSFAADVMLDVVTTAAKNRASTLRQG